MQASKAAHKGQNKQNKSNGNKDKTQKKQNQQSNSKKRKTPADGFDEIMANSIKIIEKKEREVAAKKNQAKFANQTRDKDGQPRPTKIQKTRDNSKQDSQPPKPKSEATADGAFEPWEFKQMDQNSAMEVVLELIKPLTWTEFLRQHWALSTPILLSSSSSDSASSRVGFSCASPSAIAKALKDPDAAPYRYRTDAHAARYDASDDDIEDPTPAEPEVVTPAVMQEVLGSGFGLALFHVEMKSAAIKRLTQALDVVWNGDGSVSTFLQATPAGVAPFGVYAHPSDRLIVQLYGEKRMQLFYPRTLEQSVSATDPAAGTAYPYLLRGPTPLVVHQVDSLVLPPDGQQYCNSGTPAGLALDALMKPGDALYVPANFLTFCEPGSEDDAAGSYDMHIVLTPQVSYQELIEASLRKASQFYLEPGVRKLSSLQHKGKTECLRSSATDAQDVLTKALELLPQAVNMFGARTSIRSDHFNVQSWLSARYGENKLEALLKRFGGLIKLKNFLPQAVTKRILSTFQAIKEEEWLLTAAYEDASQNNIDHKFRSAKTFANADPIFSIFKALLPDHESSFSAGRYTTGHYIAPHDDRAYKVLGDTTYSRYVALIYYLTPDWTKEDGGALLDVETKKEYIPEYNSAILFTVPRWHEVKPVLSVDKQRLSVFGWFLKPGQSYELNNGQEASDE